MPLKSVAAQNASLDNDYGVTRGPHAADSHELVLLGSTGAELSGVGYSRATIDPADWPNAAGGSKSVQVTFADPTGEWEPVTSYELVDADTGDLWDGGDLADPLFVTSAGDGPVVSVTVFYQV